MDKRQGTSWQQQVAGFVISRGIAARLRYQIGRSVRPAGMSLALVLVLMSNVLGQAAGVPAAFAQGMGGPHVSHTPNTLTRFRTTGNAWERQPGKFTTVPLQGKPVYHGLAPSQAPASIGAPLAHPIVIDLGADLLASSTASAGTAGSATTWFKSQNDAVELGVPAHSVDLGSATNAAVLVLQQTAGGFRGQSMQLAQFTLTVQDSRGAPVLGASLLAPLQLRLHYAPHELDGLNTASLRLSWPQTMDLAHHKAAVSVPVSVDAKNRTLTATVSTLSAGPMVVTATQTDVNTASSEHVTNDGNQGADSFSIPLDVPPAAGGLAPNLQLVYSSAGPNGRHAPTAPAPALGDGWDLSLGSISYDSSTQLYYLNGIGGFSEPLLCCMVDSKGNELFAPQHDPQVRVYTSDNSKYPAQENSDGSCFHVETPDGTIYDLGCTNDSRHATPSGSSFVATEWDVDHVQRKGNTSSGDLQQYGVTYWQDISTLNGTNFARDSFIALIQYNYIGSNPNARIYFNIHMPGPANPIGPAQSHQYFTNYNCASTPSQSTTVRCDDPITPAGWEQAPYTMSTITVDDIFMQVWSGGAWHTVRQYHLSYNKDDPWGTCWDQFTGQNYACAGDHTLQSVQEIPYQIVNATDTAMPSRQPITFGYTYFLTNEYHDTTELPTGNPNAPYDVQNHWRFLNSLYDQETGVNYSVAYETGYGNTHGVSSGSVTDPTTCDTKSNCTSNNNWTWPDDRQWPQQLVKSITDNGTGTTTSYSYVLNTPCGSGCTQDSWIPPNGWNACGDQGLPPTNPNQPCLEGTFSSYYNQVFTGFAQVYETHPDGSTTVTQYYAGNGWGTNDWDDGNRLRGKTVSTRLYAGAAGSSPLLTETDDTGYSDATNDCPATSGGSQLYNNPYIMCMVFQTQKVTKDWEGAPGSATVPTRTDSWSYHDGSIGTNHFYMQLNSTSVTANNLLADSLANYGTSQPTFTTNYSYVWRDDAVVGGTPGYYLVNLQAQSTLTDSAGTQWSCTQTSFDGLGFETGAQTNLVDGLATRSDKFASGTCGDTATVVTTGTGYDTYGQTIATSDADAIAGIAGHTNGCTPSAIILVGYSNGESTYTTCTDYDATTHAYVTRSGNALNQHTTATWDLVQGVQTQSTDLNGIATTYAGPVYEYSGSPSLSTYLDTYTQTTLPGETYGTPGIAQSPPWTMRVYTFSFCSQATSGTLPCMETDTVSQFDGTDLAVKRELYDRDGRLVETRTSGPSTGNDVVTITQYDDVHDKVFTSNACEVPSLSGSNGRLVMGSYYASVLASYAGGSAPSSYVDLNNPPSGSTCGGVTGTTTYKDAQGRTVATDDALGTGAGTNGTGCLLGSTHHTTCTTYAAVVASSVAGLPSSDSEPYLQVVTVDANLHQSATYTDENGKVAYEQRFAQAGQTPLASGVTSYAVTSYKYDPAGNLRVIVQPGGQTTTFTYDDIGRKMVMSDPDLGTWSYSFDPNGNQVQSQDPRIPACNGAPICPTHTLVYTGYDGLNRQLWRNTSNSASGAYVTYTYDQGTNGIGHTSTESFTGGTASDPLSGSYSYAYDQRGQTTSLTQTDTSGGGNTAYTLKYSYNDAGKQTSLTYSDGEVLSLDYNATDWLSDVTTLPAGASSINLLTNISYNGAAGLAGHITGAYMGNGIYQYSAGYDDDLRLTGVSIVKPGQPIVGLFSSQRGYDAVGNVTSVSTSLPAGTDNQVFCYDEQNRLVWAGASGTPSCGTSLTPGSLTAAQYTQSFAYDILGRLTSGPLGSYTYGDSAHLHAATSIGTGSPPPYTATYDAVGDMTCRSTSTTLSASCYSGTNGGAQMTYDAERRLSHWQNTASSPTQAADSLYDGEGNRVVQKATVTTCNQVCSTTWTTTDHLAGGAEEVTNGGFTKYYTAGGMLIGVNNGGTISYLASDGLGSVSVALDGSGHVTAAQLYAPYGGTRYSSGTMPTSKGFTGQRADSLTGLDYYNARYYDPAAGQFTSADSVLPGDGYDPWGLSRFAYVQGNPETATDPTGHRVSCPTPDGCDDGSNPPSTCNAACRKAYQHTSCSFEPDCGAPLPEPPHVPRDLQGQAKFFYNLAIKTPQQLAAEGLPPYAPNGMPWALFLNLYYPGDFNLAKFYVYEHDPHAENALNAIVRDQAIALVDQLDRQTKFNWARDNRALYDALLERSLPMWSNEQLAHIAEGIELGKEIVDALDWWNTFDEVMDPEGGVREPITPATPSQLASYGSCPLQTLNDGTWTSGPPIPGLIYD